MRDKLYFRCCANVQVDRAIKDDKKILREASTRFLFVKGGDDPDPRCCLVLAQPSTGR